MVVATEDRPSNDRHTGKEVAFQSVGRRSSWRTRVRHGLGKFDGSRQEEGGNDRGKGLIT